MRSMGDDRSQFGQPMHGLDVALEVWSEIPSGAEVFAQITRLKRGA